MEKKIDFISLYYSTFNMRIILLFFISFPLFSQNYLPVDERFVSDSFSVLSPLESESGIPENAFFIGRKSMVLSLLLPGAGQYYNRSPLWKSALFISVEILGVTSTIKWKQSGETVRRKFESFADKHWELERWFFNTKIIFPDYWQNILNGTHKLTLVVNGKYISSDELVDLLNEYSWADIHVIRDRDFYENIGKYDQFVGGWDDEYDNPFDSVGNWYTVNKGSSRETIILTNQKDYYRGLRHKSNVFKSRARYAVTGLLYNHIVSGFEAFLDAKNRKDRNSRVSYKLNLYPDPSFSRGLGGVRIILKW